MRHVAHRRQYAGATAGGTCAGASIARGDDLVGFRHVADHAALRDAGIGRVAVRVGLEIHQWRAGGDGVAWLAVQGSDDAREGRRYFDHRLGGLHRHHGLVDFHAIADGNVPADDLRFLQAFAKIGQVETRHVQAFMVVRMASTIRATLGI